MKDHNGKTYNGFIKPDQITANKSQGKNIKARFPWGDLNRHPRARQGEPLILWGVINWQPDPLDLAPGAKGFSLQN